MLSDISEEHYQWVAGGDKTRPDSTTGEGRTDLFVKRCEVLIDEGHVLTMPHTYTGEVLNFLKRTKTVVYGNRAATVGLGALSDADVQDVVAKALRKARELVANIRAFLPLYRNKDSWSGAFRAFRLPSILSPAASAGDATRKPSEEDKQEVHAGLTRVCCKAAGCREAAKTELLQLLPRAEVHAKSSCGALAAWGRASQEFPERQEGRKLVEALLIFGPNTGDVERRFKDRNAHKPSARGQMLDNTVEDLMLTDSAPPAAALHKALADSADHKALADSADKNSGAVGPLHAYFKSLGDHDRAAHGELQRARATGPRKQRRDAGVARDGEKETAHRERLGAPLPETKFRKRRAEDIAAALAGGPQKRARTREQHVLGNVAARVGREEIVASAAVQARVAKRLGAADAKPAKAAKPARAFVSRDAGGAKDVEDSAPAGVALATQRLQPRLERFHFKVTHDPVEFVRVVSRVRGRAPKCGHLALVPTGIRTDFSLAARLAAALMGAYKTSPTDYDSRGLQCSGSQFKPFYKQSGDISSFSVAVSATLAAQFPTVPAVLRRVATCPGSRLVFYQERDLQKQFKKATKKKKALGGPIASCVRKQNLKRDKKQIANTSFCILTLTISVISSSTSSATQCVRVSVKPHPSDTVVVSATLAF